MLQAASLVYPRRKFLLVLLLTSITLYIEDTLYKTSKSVLKKDRICGFQFFTLTNAHDIYLGGFFDSACQKKIFQLLFMREIINVLYFQKYENFSVSFRTVLEESDTC